MVEQVVEKACDWLMEMNLGISCGEDFLPLRLDVFGPDTRIVRQIGKDAGVLAKLQHNGGSVARGYP